MQSFTAVFVACLAVSVAAYGSRLHDVPPTKCLHGGELNSDGVCECLLNYEGKTCEQQICVNGGVPAHGEGIKCECPFGTMGEHCEFPSDCEDGKGKMVNKKCVCNDGYVGIRCQEKPCKFGKPIPSTDGLSYTCKCANGYTGTFCTRTLPCKFGKISNENECVCKNGFSGKACDECEHVVKGDTCYPEIQEEQLKAESPLFPFAWPIMAAIAGAVILMLALLVSAVFAVRSWRAKPSRVSSSQGSAIVPPEGTDV